MAALGIEEETVKFVPRGEDIRARKGGGLWKIECKGLGTDVRSATVRNNFDRALASTVSYYDRYQGLRLGLALPEEYQKHIRDRLPEALRIALNLWVLIYVNSDKELYVFSPSEEIPV